MRKDRKLWLDLNAQLQRRLATVENRVSQIDRRVADPARTPKPEKALKGVGALLAGKPLFTEVIPADAPTGRKRPKKSSQPRPDVVQAVAPPAEKPRASGIDYDKLRQLMAAGSAAKAAAQEPATAPAQDPLQETAEVRQVSAEIDKRQSDSPLHGLTSQERFHLYTPNTRNLASILDVLENELAAGRRPKFQHGLAKLLWSVHRQAVESIPEAPETAPEAPVTAPEPQQVATPLSSTQVPHRPGKLPRGVRATKSGKFQGQITIAGKYHCSRRFNTPEEAHRWYLDIKTAGRPAGKGL